MFLRTIFVCLTLTVSACAGANTLPEDFNSDFAF